MKTEEKNFIPIIVGRGKLATAVINYCNEIEQNFLLWNEVKDSFKKKEDEFYVILYASNADKFMEVYLFHLHYTIPLINGCTDVIFKTLDKIEYDLIINNESRCIIDKNNTNNIMIIDAPNWDLPIVGWMAAIKKYGKLISYSGENMTIKESHQSSKKSVPGTAKVFAKGLDLGEHDIQSERNPDIQQNKWGVSPEYLDGHACHLVEISYENSLKKTGFFTRVMGRKDYAKGGLDIAKIIMKNFDEIPNDIYTIEDLVDMDFF